MIPVHPHTRCMQYLADAGYWQVAEIKWVSCAAEDILDDAIDQEEGHEASAAALTSNNEPKLGSLQNSDAGQSTNGAVANDADSSASRLSESAPAKSR